MKFLTILSFIVVLLGADARYKKLYEPEESCTAELKLNKIKMKALINEDNTPEGNQKHGEFLLCVFKRRGIMDEYGTIDVGGLREFLQMLFFNHSKVTETQKVTVENVFEQCKRIHRDTKENTAIKLKNCIMKHNREFD